MPIKSLPNSRVSLPWSVLFRWKKEEWDGATCPRYGAPGVIRFLYYVIYRSTRYYPFSAFCAYPDGRCLRGE
jgi:hypothetical protein